MAHMGTQLKTRYEQPEWDSGGNDRSKEMVK